MLLAAGRGTGDDLKINTGTPGRGKRDMQKTCPTVAEYLAAGKQHFWILKIKKCVSNWFVFSDLAWCATSAAAAAAGWIAVNRLMDSCNEGLNYNRSLTTNQTNEMRFLRKWMRWNPLSGQRAFWQDSQWLKQQRVIHSHKSEQHLKANTRGALRVSSPLPVDILEKQLTNHPLVVTVCVNPAWI